MSTSYYGLSDPITSLRLEEGPGHDRLTVWEGNALAGTLVLSLGEGRHVAMMFADQDCERANTSYGGKDVGCRVNCDPALRDDLVVISEYGEVTTIGAVRALGRRADLFA